MNYERRRRSRGWPSPRRRPGTRRPRCAYFGQARRRFRTEGNRTWLAVLDLYQAIVLLDDDRRLTHARELAEAAQLVFVDVGLPAKAALAELVIARVALRAGDPATAEQWCNDAIERLATTQAPVLRFQASFVRGQIEEARGRTVTAADAYLEAHAWLETLRTTCARKRRRLRSCATSWSSTRAWWRSRSRGDPGSAARAPSPSSSRRNRAASPT